MSNDLAGNTPTVNEQMMRHIEAQIQQSASAHVHAVQNRNIVFPGQTNRHPLQSRSVCSFRDHASTHSKF